MNYSKYRDAYCEVLYLIDNMQTENKNRIPKNFLDFLEKNKTENYIVGDISLYKPDLLKNETRIILSLIYRDFFCTEEERNRLIREDKEKLEEKYSYDKIFQNKEENFVKNKENTIKEDLSLVKISKFRIFINKIKEKIINILKNY